MVKPIEERKPVESPAFWYRRVVETLARGGQLHQIVYDEQYEIWASIQSETAGLLLRYYKPGDRVLDAGCGYGALVSCFEEAKIDGLEYYGVDISPELVEIARARYPSCRFEVGDLRRLPYPDHYFDLAVARSMMDMIGGNVGEEAWAEMRRELLRVAAKLLVIEYQTPADPLSYRIEETVTHKVEGP